METLHFHITGMTCDHCASSLEAALGKVDGIRKTSVSYAERHATVDVDSGIKADTVIDAIRAKGYGAHLDDKAEPAKTGSG
jgi:mercuric reductase